jgi:hypothetical protein
MLAMAHSPAAPAQVLDFNRARALREHRRVAEQIAGALTQRVRYRYVQPRVEGADAHWIIFSPCCSRNIDPEGGEIPIARLEQPEPQRWQLHAMDHASHHWRLHSESHDLLELLDLMCLDTHREFWP